MILSSLRRNQNAIEFRSSAKIKFQLVSPQWPRNGRGSTISPVGKGALTDRGYGVGSANPSRRRHRSGLRAGAARVAARQRAAKALSGRAGWRARVLPRAAERPYRFGTAAVAAAAEAPSSQGRRDRGEAGQGHLPRIGAVSNPAGETPERSTLRRAAAVPCRQSPLAVAQHAAARRVAAARSPKPGSLGRVTPSLELEPGARAIP